MAAAPRHTASRAERATATPVAGWRLDVPFGTVRWSGAEALWSEVGVVAPTSFEELVAQVHPDDRDAFVTAIGAPRGAEEPPVIVHHRIVVPGGGVRHWQSVVQAHAPQDGRATLVHGASQDMTNQRQLLAALHAGHSSYAPAAERSDEAVVVEATTMTSPEAAVMRERGLLELLAAVATRANEAFTFAEAAPDCLELIARAVGWPVGHAWLVASDGSLVSSGAWYVDPSWDVAAFRAESEQMVLQSGVGLPGRVLGTRKPAWVEDVSADVDFRRAPAAARAGLRAGLAFPVLSGREVGVVLEFFSSSARQVDDRLLEVMRLAGAELGRVLDRDRAATAVTESERRFRAVVENNHDLITVMGADALVSYWSPSVRRILGRSPDELLGARALHLVHPDDTRRVRAMLRELLDEAGARRHFEARVAHADGSWRHLEVIGTNLVTEPGVDGIVLHARDVTEQRAAEARLVHERLHDPVTGLPNRRFFLEALRRALARTVRTGYPVTVLALDLDRFDDVNTRFGHHHGDLLLAAVARRLEEALRGHDVVSRFPTAIARLGADEFFVLCEDIQAVQDAEAIAVRLQTSLAETPIVVQEVASAMTASVGVVVSTGTSVDCDAVLSHAEAAVRLAKQAGGGRHVVFDEHASVVASEADDAYRRLRAAIEGGELEVFYQPKVELASQRLTGFEALVRWRDPTRGLVPPMEFIPLAEATGLIVPLGALVLRDACRQLAAWRAAGDDASGALVMCVNISARQFSPALAAVVRAALDDAGLPAAGLVIEITETVLMGDSGAAVETLVALKDVGVQVAVDDFGTGYSSLAYLKQFPLDELKIDRSFISRLGEDPKDTAIVGAVVALAHALDLEVVAEGVETVEQLDALRVLGCDVVQGFYYGRPRPAGELVDALAGPVMVPAGSVVTTAVHAPECVLVADDAEDIRQLAAVSLRAAGFEVHEAVDGHDALARARTVLPSHVVLDLSMPGLGGVEVCAALRNDPATSGCTILVLTARARADDKVEAFAAGADDYLVKPFTPRDLVTRLRAAAHRRERPGVAPDAR